MTKTINIGVLGGMFDPVHNGHLRSALTALEDLGLDEMRLVPCGKPVHRRSTVASAVQRIDMLSLGTAGQPQFTVDGRECLSDRPSYTYDTLAGIRSDMPGCRLFLLVGTDAFNTLPTWYRWRELFDLAHIVVMSRPGCEIGAEGPLAEETEGRMVDNVEDMQACEAGKILLYHFIPLMIASSQIRKLIAAGRSARYLMPDSVWQYISERQLYT